MFGDLSANSPNCRENWIRDGIRTGGIAGYAAESDGHRDGETPPAPRRCGVERLLAADPGAFVAAPTAVHGRCETFSLLSWLIICLF
jgi:hypothetical protein